MKKFFLTLMGLACILYVTAQTNDGYDSYDDYGSDNANQNYDYGAATGGGSFDTTSTFDNYDSYGSDGGFRNADYVRSARPAVTKKPYERFKAMPFDSAIGLVTYAEVVEVIVPDKYMGDDYSVSDSLYTRAMKWMKSEFGAKEAKKMIEAAGADKKNREGQTIDAIVLVPLVFKNNEHSTTQLGMIEFSMELRFKDGRYRYKFNNFVHIESNKTNPNSNVETYLEYYITAKDNVRNNDRVLRATDLQISTMIAGLKKSCDASPFIDDDDW